MTLTEDVLYARGIGSAVACWEEIARGVDGAAISRSPGVVAAVFPSGPERQVYNNAVLDRGMRVSEQRAALDAMEAAYADEGVSQFAAWVHESDHDLQRELGARGYSLNESTRAMAMCLKDLSVERPMVDLGPTDWDEYLRILGVPGILLGVDANAFNVYIVRSEGESVATAMAFDHAGDCGVFNVTTLEPARRRGFGTALMALHLHDARSRGCMTASLQSTEMAERMYASVGFRDLGRILEYVPGSPAAARPSRREHT